ncbi:N-acetylmuramoyl-L-alanine amidase family protein [[Clostridium] hylemonae]|uniref:N-acetylmuramoyl-L-alanine amidase family protein n=1 Tax=[Clostridium] hylemonae TaxID=89153 RepID=UPI0011064971|nr:N-acetylmuramoyl-L-alanine amidase [[Clostridium] hylemonae]
MKKKRIYVTMTLILLVAVGAAAAVYILKSPFEAKKSPVSKSAGKDVPGKMTKADRKKLVPETVKKKGITVAVDPGHQGPHVDMSAQEENAPGSGVMKQKATSGTTGSYTGLGEYELNLDVSLKVKERLEKLGYDVVMAREDNDTAVSNKERAQMANEAGADVCVRIHANGSESPASEGALCLVMSQDNPYVGRLYGESSRLAEAVLSSYCEATGFSNMGIQANDTMTGLNWSEIPVMILEMGFMTNEHDDTMMADDAFQEKMADGIVNGLEKYFEQR